MRKSAVRKWRGRLGAFVRDESGPSATEYAFLLALLILGSMVVLQSIGEDFQNLYTAIASKVPDA